MDKPFKTIDEQVAILQARGLATDDNTAAVLEREGYYSVINGYKDLFIDAEAKSAAAGEDRYLEEAKFDDIYRLFKFDRNLRMLLFSNLAIAEATLKTITAYQFARQHQDKAEAYLDKAVYRTDRAYSKRVDDFIHDLESVLGKTGTPRFRRQYIEHYANNHDGVPIWVLSNYLMLGQAFKFFDYQPESIRNAVAKSFGALYNQTHKVHRRFSHREIRLAYDHIKDFRNICAHDERLYCARVSPNNDVAFADVVRDLEKALSKEQYESLIRGIEKLVDDFKKRDALNVAPRLLKAMGVDDLETAFPIAR